MILRNQHRTMVRPYPIPVASSRSFPHAPAIIECRHAIRRELGLHESMVIVLSVDRLEDTNRVEEGLLAAERILDRGAALAFLQILSPSGIAVDRFREFGERVQAQVERINRRFGDGEAGPLILLNRYFEPHEVYRYYRAADICYVSGVHDDVNRVAKEFVAARDDEQGILVLSRFAREAKELKEALMVNPHDLEGTADVILSALTMSAKAQRARMRLLRVNIAAAEATRVANEPSGRAISRT